MNNYIITSTLVFFVFTSICLNYVMLKKEKNEYIYKNVLCFNITSKYDTMIL